MSEIWACGSLSNGSLQIGGFLGGEVPYGEKIVICMCKSHLVLGGIEIGRTAADVMAMPFVFRARAGLILFTQNCGVQAFKLL